MEIVLPLPGFIDFSGISPWFCSKLHLFSLMFLLKTPTYSLTTPKKLSQKAPFPLTLVSVIWRDHWKEITEKKRSLKKNSQKIQHKQIQFTTVSKKITQNVSSWKQKNYCNIFSNMKNIVKNYNIPSSPNPGRTEKIKFLFSHCFVVPQKEP